MLALVPGVQLKPTRKDEIIDALENFLLGPGLAGLWKRLESLEQSAVAEATHSSDGTFDRQTFVAKYGGAPAFETGENRWARKPTLLSLVILPCGRYESELAVPSDLREKLRAFVPKPSQAQLASTENLPQRPSKERPAHDINPNEEKSPRPGRPTSLNQRNTEQAAFQDLRTTLRLIDQEKLSASSKTLLPSKAAMELLCDLLREQDFFALTTKRDKWDQEIGPVKGFSWPLLAQAAKLAVVSKEKLSLTKAGRRALDNPPAQVLREIWNAWRTNTIFDEFSRIDVIKGQKGKGSRSFTPPATRRHAVSAALANCPVGRWVEVEEFSRYMRAAGFEFEVTRDCWSLYISDPEYGNFGYDGYGGWNILQERYLLCLLFEYAAPLGIIDICYEHPDGARSDYRVQWGTDDLVFLSRYDGLRYFRLTPLGAFILGLTDAYMPGAEKPQVSLTVLPNKKIHVGQGELTTDEMLLFENFADHESSGLWSLNEAKALKSIEKGAGIGEFRAFLNACDPQPLPETVESFLAGVQQRGAACVCKGTALRIECLSPEVANIIARDARAGKLCQQIGDRGLVIPADKEKSFREAINALGYGMPRV